MLGVHPKRANIERAWRMFRSRYEGQTPERIGYDSEGSSPPGESLRLR
jgi:hypothetical protein